MKKNPQSQNKTTQPSQSSSHIFNQKEKTPFFSDAKEKQSSFFSPNTIQAKLTIGDAGDKYEQEADEMAEKVVQKKNAPAINFQQMDEEENTISRKSTFEGDQDQFNQLLDVPEFGEMASNFETQLENSKGSGQTLDKQTKQQMEQSFGADFANVKIHTGYNATQMNQSIGAQAFTNGSDIYFNKGKYNPSSTAGNKLLAHELTHVVQQGAATQDKTKSSTPSTSLQMLRKQNGTTSDNAVLFKKEIQAFQDKNPEEEILQKQKIIQSKEMVGDVKQKTNRSKIQRSCSGCNGCSDKAPPSKSTKPPAPASNALKGSDVQNKINAILSQHDTLKTHTDVVKVALREIKKGKSVGYNDNAIKTTHLPPIATLLGLDLATLKSEWSWLVTNAKKGGTSYKQKEKAFLTKITLSQIKAVRNTFKKSQAHDWIRHTDASVFDLIIKHADNDITPEQLYAYTSNEGLSLFIQSRKAMGRSGSTLVNSPISGFDFLGLDDFMTDMTAKRKPLKDFLPANFTSSITPETRTNEKGREVKSAEFPDLDLAIQAAKAMLKRRRALFVEDAQNKGYTTPTVDEKVYWTYTYYNPGEFGGKAQLEKYKTGNGKYPERTLSDWITKKEYPHSLRVLEGYKTVKALKLFEK